MADRNEMNIPLIDGFRLRADDDNWIIEEESGKEGKKTWRVFGYYQKLGIGLNDLFTCVLRRSPSKTIDCLIHESERIQAVLNVPSRAEAITYAYEINLLQDRRSNK